MSEIRSQATPARDELADVVIDTFFDATNVDEDAAAPIVDTGYAVANRLLAAGWSKPRTVNSAAELDALPDGSIILFGGMAWQACEFVSKTYPEGYICWVCHESWRGELGSADVIPATVLFTPGDAG